MLLASRLPEAPHRFHPLLTGTKHVCTNALRETMLTSRNYLCTHCASRSCTALNHLASSVSSEVRWPLPRACLTETCRFSLVQLSSPSFLKLKLHSVPLQQGCCCSIAEMFIPLHCGSTWEALKLFVCGHLIGFSHDVIIFSGMVPFNMYVCCDLYCCARVPLMHFQVNQLVRSVFPYL